MKKIITPLLMLCLSAIAAANTIAEDAIGDYDLERISSGGGFGIFSGPMLFAFLGVCAYGYAEDGRYKTRQKFVVVNCVIGSALSMYDQNSLIPYGMMIALMFGALFIPVIRMLDVFDPQDIKDYRERARKFTGKP